MQLTAKVTQLLPSQTATGKNGEWKNKTLQQKRRPLYQKICVPNWGDKINDGQLQSGNLLKIDLDIESWEYNSKWYDIKACKIEAEGVSIQNNSDAVYNIDLVGLEVMTIFSHSKYKTIKWYKHIFKTFVFL